MTRTEENKIYEILTKPKKNTMSSSYKLKNILKNHAKLLSMISDKLLPIKQVLLEDVQEMEKLCDSNFNTSKETQ
jgi:hypothetical protein